MGILGLLGQQQRVQFIVDNRTVLQFDASISEDHSRESPATEFPIEDGSNISDHVLVKPFSLKMQLVISDNPIGGIKGLLTEVATTATSALLPPIATVALGGALAAFSAIFKSDAPSVAAYKNILKLQEKREPFTVLTSLYRYPNMVITSMSTPRVAQNGHILLVDFTLSELIIVSPQSIQVKYLANPGVSDGVHDAGQQSTLKSKFSEGMAAEKVDKAAFVKGLKGIVGGAS